MSEAPQPQDVAKLHGDLAVGEDLTFQQRWWRVERIIWVLFAAFVVLALAGILGRGGWSRAALPLADEHAVLRYERVERAGTLSIATLEISQAAAGTVLLWVDAGTIAALGVQRAAPEPASVVPEADGQTMAFPTGEGRVTISLLLKPDRLGPQRLRLRLGGGGIVDRPVFVLP